MNSQKWLNIRKLVNAKIIAEEKDDELWEITFQDCPKKMSILIKSF